MQDNINLTAEYEARFLKNSVSIVPRLYVVHSESRKQKKKIMRVTTRKREGTRGISVISLSEVHPIPERHTVSAVCQGDGLCVVMAFELSD